MSNVAESLQERKVSQGAFMVVRGAPPGERGDVGKLSARWREGKKMASMMKVMVGLEGSRCHLMKGLGLGVLGAGYMRHACDGTRRGARGWYKSRRLEVVGCDIRCKRKSRGRQGGEPGARGRIITLYGN
jgi:hypothetical protein